MENPNQPFPNFMFMLQRYNPRPSHDDLSLENWNKGWSLIFLSKAHLITDKENRKKEYNEIHYLVETNEGKSRRKPGEYSRVFNKIKPRAQCLQYLPARQRIEGVLREWSLETRMPQWLLGLMSHNTCRILPSEKECKLLTIIKDFETVDSWSCLVLPYKALITCVWWSLFLRYEITA